MTDPIAALKADIATARAGIRCLSGCVKKCHCGAIQALAAFARIEVALSSSPAPPAPDLDAIEERARATLTQVADADAHGDRDLDRGLGVLARDALDCTAELRRLRARQGVEAWDWPACVREAEQILREAPRCNETADGVNHCREPVGHHLTDHHDGDRMRWKRGREAAAPSVPAEATALLSMCLDVLDDVPAAIGDAEANAIRRAAGEPQQAPAWPGRVAEAATTTATRVLAHLAAQPPAHDALAGAVSNLLACFHEVGGKFSVAPWQRDNLSAAVVAVRSALAAMCAAIILPVTGVRHAILDAVTCGACRAGHGRPAADRLTCTSPRGCRCTAVLP